MTKFYKSAGYTHYVSWETYDKKFNMFLKKGFPTTQDAVEKHVSKMKNDLSIVNLKAEKI